MRRITYRVFNIGVPVGNAPSFASTRTDTNTSAAYLVDAAHVEHEEVAITGPHRGWVCVGIGMRVVWLHALDGRARAAVAGGGCRSRPILRTARLSGAIRATARLVRLLLVLARQIRTCEQNAILSRSSFFVERASCKPATPTAALHCC